MNRSPTHFDPEAAMPIQRPPSISQSARDARAELRAQIRAMASGFNLNTCRGDFAVHGEDTQAVAALLAGRIACWLSGARAGSASAATRGGNWRAAWQDRSTTLPAHVVDHQSAGKGGTSLLESRWMPAWAAGAPPDAGRVGLLRIAAGEPK